MSGPRPEANEFAPVKPNRLAVVLVILLPAVYQAVVVRLFAVNMLVWDEFYYVQLMRDIGEGRPWVGWIWRQHNEHRIVWTKLVMLAHASFSGWNPVVEMYVSAALMGLITLGVWKLYRRAGGREPVSFLPAALLLCSLAQYMNMLYGLMTCHYFTLAGMVWSLVFLLRRTWTGLLAAIASGFVAMLSTLNAILIWPVGLVVLFLTRQKWPRWLAWILAMITIALVYFHGYQKPGHHDMEIAPGMLLPLVAGGVACLGSPLSAGSVVWAGVLGLMTLVVIALTWVGVAALRDYERHAGLIALTLIGLGCVAMVAIGRRGPALMESKYITYTTLALAGTYLSLVCIRGYRVRRLVLPGFVALLGAGLLAANVAGFLAARAWRKQRRVDKYLLQTADIQPPESLAGLYHVDVRGIAAYLRATNLGPFRDRVDALMAPRWRDGSPSGEIMGSTPVRTELLCPVGTLLDAGIAFSPISAGRSVGSIHVSIRDDGVVVARSVLDASTVDGLTWVRVVPDKPLRDCRGKTLVVDIWSQGAVPGSGLHVWTYPVYYPGITRQGRVVIEQRSLGLSFNGFASGLVP